MPRQDEIDGLLAVINAPAWKFWVTGQRRALAAKALGRIGKAAIPSLVASFPKRGAAYALLALKEIGAAAIPACIAALSAPGGAYAALFFKEIGATCTDELIAEFKGEGAAYAHIALVELGPRALPPLTRALEDDPSEDVRMWAAMTLGAMGHWATEAIPALQAAKRDPDANVRQAAEEAIKKIGS